MKLKKNKGITLIVLVVTIVVLLILAGVTLTMVLGEGGILDMAKEAASKTKEAEKQEQGDLENLIGDIQNILGKLKADGEYDSKKGVNSPKITAEMNPVYWDENNNEVEYYNDFTGKKTVNPNFDIDKWYDYKDTSDIKNGANSSHWANVKLTDGSYFVWIPRYAYQIIDGYHTGGSGVKGTINIDFLKGNTYESATDPNKKEKTDWDNISGAKKWNVHPAFQDGNATDYKNGEWKEEVSGIWVAKFEASPQGADQTLTSGQYGETDKDLQVKPGVSSWRNTSIGNMYIVCSNYAKNVLGNGSLNSHQMKNSEWGAVAYLSHSKYGLNGAEIGMNECSTFITGAGPIDDEGSAYVYNSDNFETKHSYKTENGQKASTTGNIYGIYDMSGGAGEYLASYVDNENARLTDEDYGKKLTDVAKSTKHTVQVYESDLTTSETSTKDTLEGNYNKTEKIYGDAVYETSANTWNESSWNGDSSTFPSEVWTFFSRGGIFKSGYSGGLFSFTRCECRKEWKDGSFRPILIVPQG